MENSSRIINISRTGALVEGDHFKLEDEVLISFDLNVKKYQFNAKVVGKRDHLENQAMGLQFKINPISFVKVLFMIHQIKGAGNNLVGSRA